MVVYNGKCLNNLFKVVQKINKKQLNLFRHIIDYRHLKVIPKPCTIKFKNC